MNPLLDDDSVADGILAIARRENASAVTARSLASELHVSLGALYNYTPSMLDAMQNADRHVYAAMTAALDGATEASPQEAMWAWAQSESRLVDLITDLNRPHAPLPLSFLDLLPGAGLEIPRTAQAAEIVRSFTGLWRAGSPDLTMADFRPLAEVLTTSLNSYDPSADFSPLAIPLDALHALAVERIAVQPHDRIDDLVRAASVEVLIEGDWSFRKLQNKTGFPLARLNRMSPRADHVMTAVSDIIGGIVLKYVADERPVIESIRSLVATIAEHASLLIDTQRPFISLSLVDSMTTEPGLGATASMEPRQAMLASGLATAVLHAGHANRETDPTASAASVPLTIDIAERSYARLTAS